MDDDAVTDLGTTRADKLWTVVVLGGGGMLLLLASPWLAGWLSDLPFVPFQGVLDRVASYDEWWAWAARPVVGLVVGLVAALLVLADEHRLEVGADGVVVVHDRDRRRLRRSQIVGVHQDGKTVVIDGEHGRVLFDQRVEAGREKVRAAFVDREYPWESE